MKIAKHYIANKDVIDFYIKTNARLQEGMDLLRPFVDFYNKKGYTLSHNCQDCLIDMLIYCRKEIKEINETTKTKQTTESIEATEAPSKKKK